MKNAIPYIFLAIIAIASFMLGRHAGMDKPRQEVVSLGIEGQRYPYSLPVYALPDTSRAWTYADDCKLADFEARLIIAEAEVASFKAWKMKHGR